MGQKKTHFKNKNRTTQSEYFFLSQKSQFIHCKVALNSFVLNSQIEKEIILPFFNNPKTADKSFTVNKNS
jgi:hypothetical protein